MQQAYISECFYSLQGEGKYTGCPSVFLRLFGCNLNCCGFGQKNPTESSTYEIEELNYNVSSIAEVQVPKYGCDTPYSRDKGFLHLCKHLTVKQVASDILSLINQKVQTTDCRFKCDNNQDIHLVITGGEPLLQQPFIAELIEELSLAELNYITIETNGTLHLQDCLLEAVKDKHLFLSVSPKLFCCSGVPTEQGIKLNVLDEYQMKVPNGQLKFVASTNLQVWNEIKDIISNLLVRRYPVVIMPVGSTLEQLQANSTEIAERCLACGYNFSGRLHVNLWGNKSGT